MRGGGPSARVWWPLGLLRRCGVGPRCVPVIYLVVLAHGLDEILAGGASQDRPHRRPAKAMACVLEAADPSRSGQAWPPSVVCAWPCLWSPLVDMEWLHRLLSTSLDRIKGGGPRVRVASR
jgi:hypothetical protein